MTENPDRINQLIERLEMLSKQQELFSKEIYALRNELFQLKSSAVKQEPIQSKEKGTPKSYEESGFKVMPEDQSAAINTRRVQIPKPVMPQFNLTQAAKKSATKR